MKKRIKKIVWLSFLIAVRQAWGWMCNLYLLSYQPFLTIRTLKKERDKSQTFLLATTAVLPGIFYVMARIGWDFYRYGRLLRSIGPVFLVTMTIEAIIFAYLFYWLKQVISKNHMDSFVEGKDGIC
ncbi:hypothetical protein KJ909_01810 [Patescibacteria group bacterium]|nr:hypothetical protein [Patescibacteria group bacterium]